MKVIFTLHNYAAAVHIGGGVESESFTLDIDNSLLPLRIKQFMEKGEYETLSLSFEKTPNTDFNLTQPAASQVKS